MTARSVRILDHAEIAGGGQRFALRLARYVSEARGWDVRMVCPPDSALADWCAEAGVPVQRADFPPFEPRRTPKIATALWRTGALLRAAPRETLLVANSARVQAYLFGASRAAGTRRVINVMHEQDSARRPSAMYAYRRFGSLLVIGDAAAAAYRERLPGVAVGSANNFLLDDERRPFEALRRGAVAAASGPPALAVIGRMIPEKGLVELVDELAGDRLRPLWGRLTIAAFPQDQAYERRLRERIGQLDLASRVDLPGPLPATEVLANADALVVPSVGHEAQPTVIVEALAAGAPVIVRDSLWSEAYEGLPVTRYSSPDELARILGRLPRQPAALELVASRFGPEQFVAALEVAAG